MLVDPNKRDLGWAENSNSSTPVVVSFFDDQKGNIDDCVLQRTQRRFFQRVANATNFYRNLDLKCVFVPSTFTAHNNSIRDLVEAHNKTMAAINRDPNASVRSTGKLFAHLMVDDKEPYFYDSESGVSAQTLEAHAGSDVWVFDFDNTLTLCSGIMSYMDPQEEKRAFGQGGDAMYEAWANNLRQNLAKELPNKTPADYDVASWNEIDLSPTVVMRVLMGGTGRYNRIHTAYIAAGRQGRLADVYILTSNTMYPIIGYLCSHFFNTDLSTKTFSMHSVALVLSANQKHIEYQDKGKILAEYILPAIAKGYAAQKRLTF